MPFRMRTWNKNPYHLRRQLSPVSKRREVAVNNNGCGERRKYLTCPVADMCEKDGGQVFKMPYTGPDTGNSNVKIPMPGPCPPSSAKASHL